MLDELIRHPIRFSRYIVRRIAQIPSRGVPALKVHRQDAFDRRYGVDTFAPVRAIKTNSANLAYGNKYEASSEAAVRWSIENCGMPIEETTFIDIGCGKGRALIVAATYPFSKIIGIEYSGELVEICRRNLEKLKIEARCDVVVADAAEYRFPDEDLLVFLYYPFTSKIYDRVLQNLCAVHGSVQLANHGPGKDAIEQSGRATILAAGQSTTLYRLFSSK